MERVDEDDGGDGKVLKSDFPRPPPKGWDEVTVDVIMYGGYG